MYIKNYILCLILYVHISTESDLPVIDTVNATSNTTVLVTWKDPKQPDTVITGYHVIYYEYQSNDRTTSDTLDNNTLSYFIDSLSKNI